MTSAAASPVSLAPTAPAGAASPRAQRAGRPFFGLIESVIVESPASFEFDGAVSREHANAIWTWMARDLAPELIDPAVPESDAARKALDALMPELLSRARKAVSAASSSFELERRLKSQLGGELVWARLPVVLNALKCRTLLDKAQAFGRAANNMPDEAGMALALQSMPLQDQAVSSLLFMAALGQVTNPAKLITAVIRIAGSARESTIQAAGFSPLVEAILAHAQNQTHSLNNAGAFSDVDQICRSIERFHRLARAINGYVELSRNSRWTTTMAALTRAMSERVEPRLREVAGNLNIALRRGREGSDRLDSDMLLVALHGVYVLASVRAARDSLGVNATLDQVWQQVGQALEIHIERNLEVLRANPADTVTSARLDAAITMAGQRFNAEYAAALRRSKESAERPH